VLILEQESMHWTPISLLVWCQN